MVTRVAPGKACRTPGCSAHSSPRQCCATDTETRENPEAEHGPFASFSAPFYDNHTLAGRNQSRLDVHFIPDSWCTRLLRRICRRCLNLLDSFPPLGRKNSLRNGRNTGRLWRETPRHPQTDTFLISQQTPFDSHPLRLNALDVWISGFGITRND